MAIQGFDKNFYLNAKLAQLQSNSETAADWAGKDAAFLEARFAAVGLTAEAHYEQYGFQENLAPNAFFNPAEYIRAKATAMFNDANNAYLTIDAAAQDFVNLWGGNVYNHYLQYGEKEGVNPSNAFDVSGYYEAKLAQLQAAGNTDITTVAQLKASFDAAGITALEHFITYGQGENITAPAVPAGEQVSPEEATNPGETFSLTTGIDALQGTAGNDTFIGDNVGASPTASAADQLDGGAGQDTLKLFGNAAEPTHTNIETVYLNGNTAGFDVSDNASVTELQLDNVATAQTYTVANGQKASLANMADNEVVDFAGNTVTALDLTLNGVGTATGAGVDVDLNSTAQTTLNLTTATKASHVELVNTGTKLTTVSVAGDQALTLDANSNSVGLAAVNASAFTGALNLMLDDAAGTAKNVTVTGGTGNDTANFGAALTKDDKFDGGEGTDTLEVTQASVTTVQGLNATDKATLNTNLANIEVLKVTDALTSDIDASRFDGIQNYVLAGGLGTTGTKTLSKVSSGVTVGIQDAAVNAANVLAVEITDATLAGNNSDVLNVNLNDAAGAGASDIGVINAVGVDTLNINTASTTAAGAAGTTTSYTLDIAATSSALDKVAVTGNIALDLGGVALANAIGEVDASGMTLANATSNGLTVAIATGGTNGVKITGSSGVDSLTGGDAADIIMGGAGNDTITGGAGNDQLTGGAGSDTFVFGATAAANGQDTILDFKGGAVADGGDVLNFGAFITTAVSANNLTLTTSSSNVSLADNNVFALNTAANITGKDFGGADFAEIFGAGNGQFNTTVGASTQSVVLVKGADSTQVYYADSSVDGTATDFTAADVALVGTLTVDGTFLAANFA